MSEHHQPRHVTVLAVVASLVWCGFFATIAFGAHWGWDSWAMLVVTIAATAAAIGASARSMRR